MGSYVELRRAIHEFLSVVNVVGVEVNNGTRQCDWIDIGRKETSDPCYVELGHEGVDKLTWGGLGEGHWDENWNEGNERLDQLGKGCKGEKGFEKSQ